eukprot:553424-Prymnesium_polylepis.2
MRLEERGAHSRPHLNPLVGVAAQPQRRAGRHHGRHRVTRHSRGVARRIPRPTQQARRKEQLATAATAATAGGAGGGGPWRGGRVVSSARKAAPLCHVKAACTEGGAERRVGLKASEQHARAGGKAGPRRRAQQELERHAVAARGALVCRGKRARRGGGEGGEGCIGRAAHGTRQAEANLNVPDRTPREVRAHLRRARPKRVVPRVACVVAQRRVHRGAAQRPCGDPQLVGREARRGARGGGGKAGRQLRRNVRRQPRQCAERVEELLRREAAAHERAQSQREHAHHLGIDAVLEATEGPEQLRAARDIERGRTALAGGRADRPEQRAVLDLH